MSDAALLVDPLLRAIPVVEGYKLLPPCLVTGKLGGGGMGMVYRGYHTKLEIDVAIKLLSPLIASQDVRFVERFQREARLAARIAPDNPNLIHVYDVAEAFGLHYIVMELVRGETLRERVKRKGPLGEREALAILAGAANGLAAAHTRGVVHRDIKPDNLMVTREGRVKVADLGLAKADIGAEQSMSVVMGTPKYMAPEHWVGMEHVLPPTDVWALGATLFFMLKGEDPFAGSSQGERFPDVDAKLPKVSPACRALLSRCVVQEPAARFADAGALRDAIRTQWPEQGEALADADAGKGTMRATTINQPAPETVRAARATVMNPGDDALTLAPRRARADTPVATAPAASPSPLSSWSGSRKRWGLIAIGVALLIAGATFVPPLLRGANAEAAIWLRKGIEQIKTAAKFDEGVQSLEKARVLESDNQEIVAKLVDAYYLRAMIVDRSLAPRLQDAKAAIDLDRRPEIVELLEQLKGDARLRLQTFTTQPKDKGVVARSVDVEVKVADAELVQSVTIAGKRASFLIGSARGNVTFDKDGMHSIEVVVCGPSGIEIERSIEVVVDSESPRVELKSPAENDLLGGGSVKLTGTVRDLSPVTVVVSAPGIDRLAAKVSDEGFAVDVPLPKTKGPFAMQVTASDGRNKDTVVTRTVRIDTSLPQITVGDYPQRTKEPTATIRVQVKDAVEVKIAGERVQPDGGERVVALVDGRNTIMIEARGRTGSPVEQELKLELDRQGPVIEGLPANVLAGETVEVDGRLSEVGKLKIDGQRVDVVDRAFKHRIAVDSKRREPIVVVATDDLGNEARAQINVTAPAEKQALPLPNWPGHKVVDARPGPNTNYPVGVEDLACGIVFRLVEPGEFTMGAASTQTDQPPHLVRITKAFYLAECETTLAQWQRFADAQTGLAVVPEHPVTKVSWDNVKDWLLRLNRGANGPFRLPTEAEWEYACRAGKPTKYAFGDELTKEQANFGLAGTMVVRQRRANLWDFYDMHGNVAEWCEDVYDANYYKNSPTDDPPGPQTLSDKRVTRGGSYTSSAQFLQSAGRGKSPAKTQDKAIGFRVARSI